MPEYKVYSIAQDGHIAAPPTIVDCPDDLTAIKNARQPLDGHDLEIWEGTRVVAYLIPESFAEIKKRTD